VTIPTRNSYIVVLLTLLLAGWFGLGTPLIAALFSSFVLHRLTFLRRKSATVLVFLVLVSVICTGLVYFLDQAVRTLPRVATTAIPSIIQYAQEHGLDLPFSDWDSLKTFAMENVKGQLPYIGNFAKIAAKQFVFLLIGIVVAISIFLNPATDLNAGGYAIRNNVYSVYAAEIAARFRLLYHAFDHVMGAQLLISTLNTGLTSVFLLWVALPYTPLMLFITFTCGLLPILGNLISNSIIVGFAFTVSPNLAIAALVFLVVLHKLEYFLNSKIVGERIKNPIWLTLIGLILGERLMGLTGMILAPAILNYIKMEASRIKVGETNDPATQRTD
jgi:predicted PurR-regulated permease PerM